MSLIPLDINKSLLTSIEVIVGVVEEEIGGVDKIDLEEIAVGVEEEETALEIGVEIVLEVIVVV